MTAKTGDDDTVSMFLTKPGFVNELDELDKLDAPPSAHSVRVKSDAPPPPPPPLGTALGSATPPLPCPKTPSPRKHSQLNFSTSPPIPSTSPPFRAMNYQTTQSTISFNDPNDATSSTWGTDEGLFMTRKSLTSHEEVTLFKQKLVFGVKLKKINQHHTVGSVTSGSHSKEVTLRLHGSGSGLAITWDSKKNEEIGVKEIAAVRADDSNKWGKKKGDVGRILTIATPGCKDRLVLKAKSTRECFWMIRGLSMLMNEAKESVGETYSHRNNGGRGNSRAASVVDMDLAAELFDSDSDEDAHDVLDSDIANLIKNVEMTGEVKLRHGKNLSDKQLAMMQETFEARQGAASILQKIVRRMMNPGQEQDVHFSPEELLGCFKIFDEDGDGHISTSELRHVLTNIGGMRMSEQEVAEIVRRFDTDGDGEVDYEEFAAGLVAASHEERQEIKHEARQEVQNQQKVKQQVVEQKRTSQVKEIVSPIQEYVEAPPANAAQKMRGSKMGAAIVVEAAGSTLIAAKVIEGLGGITLPARDSYGNGGRLEYAEPARRRRSTLKLGRADTPSGEEIVEKRLSGDVGVSVEQAAEGVMWAGEAAPEPAPTHVQIPEPAAAEPTAAEPAVAEPARKQSVKGGIQLVGNAYNEPIQVTEDPLGWGVLVDETSGATYYYNYTTGESSWTNPEEEEAPVAAAPVAAGGELPAGWQEVNDETYGLYYYCYVDGLTSYEYPTEPVYAQEESGLPEGWQAVEDAEYGTYYWNSVSGDTTYELPT